MGGGARVLDKSEDAESLILSSLITDSYQQIKTGNNLLLATVESGSSSEDVSTTSVNEISSSSFSKVTLDLGFRVFKIASSNFLPSYFQVDTLSQDMLSALEGNIKSDRSDLDLLLT